MSDIVRPSYMSIPIYSAQRKRETGYGYYSFTIKSDDPDRENKIKAERLKQKKLNQEYKKSLSNIKYLNIDQPTIYNTTDNVQQPLQLPQINIPKFDRTPFILKLDPYTGNTIFILGSSKTGKSSAIMRIYDQYYSDKKIISILWTNNPQIKLYKKHENLLISGKWNKDCEKLIVDQKKIQTKTKNEYKFLNMFDDVIDVRNNRLLDNLILTYRNSKISSIISLQYSNLMSKCSRANCNNILAFSFNTDESIEVVIKTFLTGYLKSVGIIKLGDQINWYKSITQDHGFIYIKPQEGIVSFHKFNI